MDKVIMVLLMIFWQLSEYLTLKRQIVHEVITSYSDIMNFDSVAKITEHALSIVVISSDWCEDMDIKISTF